MPTDLQHARQVVNVFFQLGDADDHARRTGQFRTLAGFPLRHHAHINKVGAHFPEHAFNQARVDTLQGPAESELANGRPRRKAWPLALPHRHPAGRPGSTRLNTRAPR